MDTIPLLELTAVVVSVRVSEMLRQELQYEGVQEIFWMDNILFTPILATLLLVMEDWRSQRRTQWPAG